MFDYEAAGSPRASGDPAEVLNLGESIYQISKMFQAEIDWMLNMTEEEKTTSSSPEGSSNTK